MAERELMVRAYHPADYEQAEVTVFEQTLDDDQMQIGFTFEQPLEASVEGDKRPLIIQMRQVKGDFSPLGPSLFTMTGARQVVRGEVVSFGQEVAKQVSPPTPSQLRPAVPVEYRWTTDPTTLTATDWTTVHSIHADSVDLRRLHVTWDPAAPVAGGVAVTEENEVTLFAQALGQAI